MLVGTVFLGSVPLPLFALAISGSADEEILILPAVDASADEEVVLDVPISVSADEETVVVIEASADEEVVVEDADSVVDTAANTPAEVLVATPALDTSADEEITSTVEVVGFADEEVSVLPMDVSVDEDIPIEIEASADEVAVDTFVSSNADEEVVVEEADTEVGTAANIPAEVLVATTAVSGDSEEVASAVGSADEEVSGIPVVESSADEEVYTLASFGDQGVFIPLQVSPVLEVVGSADESEEILSDVSATADEEVSTAANTPAEVLVATQAVSGDSEEVASAVGDADEEVVGLLAVSGGADESSIELLSVVGGADEEAASLLSVQASADEEDSTLSAVSGASEEVYTAQLSGVQASADDTEPDASFSFISGSGDEAEDTIPPVEGGEDEVLDTPPPASGSADEEEVDPLPVLGSADEDPLVVANPLDISGSADEVEDTIPPVEGGADEVIDTPPVSGSADEDLCSNIAQTQVTVPVGYTANNDGTCTAQATSGGNTGGDDNTGGDTDDDNNTGGTDTGGDDNTNGTDTGETDTGSDTGTDTGGDDNNTGGTDTGDGDDTGNTDTGGDTGGDDNSGGDTDTNGGTDTGGGDNNTGGGDNTGGDDNAGGGDNTGGDNTNTGDDNSGGDDTGGDDNTSGTGTGGNSDTGGDDNSGGGTGGSTTPATGGDTDVVVTQGGGGGGGTGFGAAFLGIYNEAVIEISPGVLAVQWTTNQPGISRVVFGTTSVASLSTTSPFLGYQESVNVNVTPTTNHVAIFDGLTVGQKYFFRPLSTKDGYKEVAGKELSFTATRRAEIKSVADQCPYLSGYLQKGELNDITQVVFLQAFLSLHEELPVTISGTYDEETERAVHAFQNKYADEVLLPWGGDVSSTGYVYITTKWKINQIVCGSAELTLEEQEIISSYQSHIKAVGVGGSVTTPVRGQELELIDVPSGGGEDERTTDDIIIGLQDRHDEQLASVLSATDSIGAKCVFDSESSFLVDAVLFLPRLVYCVLQPAISPE